MTMKVTKYGTAYEAPIGLEEEKYYELMYEFVNLANAKGLTIRQAQKLFIDCTDMILDVKSDSIKNTNKNKLSDMDRLINKLDDIKVRLEDIPQYKALHSDNPQY